MSDDRLHVVAAESKMTRLYADWLERRSFAFQGASARYFKQRAKKQT